MARVASQHVTTPTEVVVPARLMRSLALRWSISRAAARSCGLVGRESGAAVCLEVLVSGPGGAGDVSARVRDGDAVIPIEGSRRKGVWIEDSIRGVWHLDIDGLLKLTIRLSPDRVEALYARTELLSQAGLAGGRYEFEGASIDDCGA